MLSTIFCKILLCSLAHAGYPSSDVQKPVIIGTQNPGSCSLPAEQSHIAVSCKEAPSHLNQIEHPLKVIRSLLVTVTVCRLECQAPVYPWSLYASSCLSDLYCILIQLCSAFLPAEIE